LTGKLCPGSAVNTGIYLNLWKNLPENEINEME
jgi:hypothetical protein